MFLQWMDVIFEVIVLFEIWKYNLEFYLNILKRYMFLPKRQLYVRVYAIANPSVVCRPSVVCNVVAPYLDR